MAWGTYNRPSPAEILRSAEADLSRPIALALADECRKWDVWGQSFDAHLGRVARDASGDASRLVWC